ncbi:MAG: hypothetical protein RLO01_19545 [Thalassobaculaceae bacterium]
MSNALKRFLRVLPVAVAVCVLCAAAAGPWSSIARAETPQPLTDRERQLMGIAASCVAFYQSAMAELELPVEDNEPKRQAFLQVFDALAKRGQSHKQYEAAFQRDVVMRTIEVTTILQNDPKTARPQVLGNLPKCDGYLDEMRTAAGLD